MNTWLLTDQAVPKAQGLEPIALAPKFQLVHDVAEEFKGKPAEGDVILIDIFLTFQDPEYRHHQDLGGIALLKFLRIKEVKNHIVLLSPWNLQQLLRMAPGYHILASKGITIAQYTYSANELNGHDGQPLDLAELAKEKAPSKEKLREWFKAGINLPKDERHNWAQWWGAECMRLMHNRAHRNKAIGQPESVSAKLRELKCAELIYVAIWPEDFDAPALALNYLSPKKGVLYVDDNCDMGWKEIVASFIYGSSTVVETRAEGEFRNASLDSIKPKVNENKEVFYGRVISKLTANKYAFVLLDVRLFAESRTTPDADLSGIELLRRIRAKHPTLPVILFTATARADFFKAFEKFGLVEHWTKPSIEDSSKEDALARSYTRLRRLLMEIAKQTRDPLGIKFAATINMIDQVDTRFFAPGLLPMYQNIVGLCPKEWMDCDLVTVDTNFYEHDDIHKVLPVLYFITLARKKAGKEPISMINHVVGELSNHQESAATYWTDGPQLDLGRRASFVLPFITNWMGDGRMHRHQYAYEAEHCRQNTPYFHTWMGGRGVGTPVKIAMPNHESVPKYRKNARADDIFVCEFVQQLKQNRHCKVLLFSNESDRDNGKIINRMRAGMNADEKGRFYYVRIDALKPIAEAIDEQLAKLSY